MEYLRAMRAWAWVIVGIGVIGGALWVVRPPPEPRPNVVLVIGCTLRRDQLTPYGAPDHVTPVLQRLASRGTRFAHAESAAPWTRAAATALLTGHHAISVGMIEPVRFTNPRRLSGAVTTLAERLQAVGYRTVGVTANPNLNRVFGFDQGFDHYYEAQGRFVEDRAPPVPFVKLVDEAFAALDAMPEGGPRYLQIVTLDTHEPRVASRRAVAREVARSDVSPRVATYRATAHRWDRGLGRLVAGLADRGMTGENTVLMVVSDHGEGLLTPPSHGPGHGRFVLPTTIDMPWVVRGQGIAEGHEVTGMASQIDVVPTLLGHLGLPADPGLPGVDHSAALAGAPSTGQDVVFADTWFATANRAAAYTADHLCMRSFVSGPRSPFPDLACFDRRTDPLATTVIADPSDLGARIEAWREARWAAFEAWPHHETIDPPAEVQRQLEALGYVEPSAGGDGGDPR